MNEPDNQLWPGARVIIEDLLGKRIQRAERVTSGYSATMRSIIHTETAESFFCKVGSTPASCDMLHHEGRVYDALHLSCMPKVVASYMDESTPVLILENLAGSHWPPPWSGDTLEPALELIGQIHSISGGLSSYAERNGPDWDWWGMIERDPIPFLRLGLVTEDWLKASLPTLIESAKSVSPVGRTVAHFDLRSDNFRFTNGDARLVDWSLACLGNPKIDLGLFLPGLAAENGPRPEELLPNEPGVAAWVAGFFAWYAGKPTIPTAPDVRTMQFQHLEAALPWAIGELGL